MSNQKTTKKIRYDRALNEREVLEFIDNFEKDQNRYPTLNEIKKGMENSISSRTVDRVIARIDLHDICEKHPSKLKLSEFVNKMYQRGMNGDWRAAKMWMALVFGWQGPAEYLHKMDYKNRTGEDCDQQ